jgi:peptidoglycan/LPS O-acetylase OafA/YrhL
MKYRPEIDGLRAISVFSVILYHAKISISGFNFLKGGFLGVDIFFVISGFLITTIILSEIKLTNNFNFFYFYERRIRRILPVLLTVTVFSSFFAYQILLPDQLLDFSDSVFSSLFFFTNYFFYFLGEQYNAPPSQFIPLLHYWSLAVEEQYYILYPLFLYLLFKKKLNALLTSILIILLFSLFFSILNTDPVLNFYSLHTRIWQLLVGGLIAYIMSINLYFFSEKVENLLVYLGFFLIIFSFFLINDSHQHMGLKSFPAVFGTALIIYSGKSNNYLIKFLSLKIITFFGLISYSLYLWHYPIFSFARLTGFIQNDFSNKILLGLFIIFLSILSYFLIEKPFRNKNKIKKKFLFTTLGLIYLLLISAIFYVKKNDGIAKRFPPILFEKYSFENWEGKIKFNENGTNGEIVLVGDSRAETLSHELNNAAIKNGYNLKRFHTHMLLPNIKEYDLITRSVDHSFSKKNKNILRYLENKKGSVVVIYSYYSLRILEVNANNKRYRKMLVSESVNEIDKTVFSERYETIKKTFINTVNQISKNHKVILIYPTPEFKNGVPNAIVRKLIFKNESKIPIITSDYLYFKNKRKLIYEMLNEITDENIEKIYGEKYFCNNYIKNKCVGNTKEHLFFSDNHHLSNHASKFLTNEIIDLIKNKDEKK